MPACMGYCAFLWLTDYFSLITVSMAGWQGIAVWSGSIGVLFPQLRRVMEGGFFILAFDEFVI